MGGPRREGGWIHFVGSGPCWVRQTVTVALHGLTTLAVSLAGTSTCWVNAADEDGMHDVAVAFRGTILPGEWSANINGNFLSDFRSDKTLLRTGLVGVRA